MLITTYYNIEVYLEESTNEFEFFVGGWCHTAKTLEEAKKEIKEWL